MKLWRQLFALLFALAWLPTVHSCEIANALGIQLADQDECGQPGSGDCDHCDFCQTLHSGGVVPSVFRVSVPGFMATIPLWQPVLTVLIVEPPSLVTGVNLGDQDCPPQRWQFAERTALPPRAPSLLA